MLPLKDGGCEELRVIRCCAHLAKIQNFVFGAANAHAHPNTNGVGF